MNFGGRNDTVYVLSYQEEGNSSRINAVMVDITMGTITGMNSPSSLNTVFLGIFILFIIIANVNVK